LVGKETCGTKLNIHENIILSQYRNTYLNIWCDMGHSENFADLTEIKNAPLLLTKKFHFIPIKFFVFVAYISLEQKRFDLILFNKALRNWKIFLKALSKRLRKITIKTKRLWQLKFFSFVNFND
jgi:hypothetical protein